MLDLIVYCGEEEKGRDPDNVPSSAWPVWVMLKKAAYYITNTVVFID